MLNSMCPRAQALPASDTCAHKGVSTCLNLRPGEHNWRTIAILGKHLTYMVKVILSIWDVQETFKKYELDECFVYLAITDHSPYLWHHSLLCIGIINNTFNNNINNKFSPFVISLGFRTWNNKKSGKKSADVENIS